MTRQLRIVPQPGREVVFPEGFSEPSPPDDADRVFEAWRVRQRIPAACRFTGPRRRLVEAALRDGYSVDDLLAVIDYAYDADTPDARWLRGETRDNRTAYMDVENLFRRAKIPARVERALGWRQEQEVAAGAPGDGNYSPPRLVFPGDPGYVAPGSRE